MNRILIFAASLAWLGVSYAQQQVASTRIDSAVQVVIYLDIDPALAARGASLLEQEADAEAQYAGCKSALLVKEDGRPNHFLLIETWRSRGLSMPSRAVINTNVTVARYCQRSPVHSTSVQAFRSHRNHPHQIIKNTGWADRSAPILENNTEADGMADQEIAESQQSKTRMFDENLYGPTTRNTVQALADVSSSNLGPRNDGVVRLAPNSNGPPATDHGSVGTLWHSFELTHRRVQEGGWTHQVTEREILLSKEIAWVIMRIVSGAFREAHWHLADEWAYMLTGKARITLFAVDGSMFVDERGGG